MGRMHGPGKGISGSAIPYRRSAHSWCKTTPATVIHQACLLARKGKTPSEIGAILRDLHGVPMVKPVTGNKILRILRANGKFS
jgi:small subunit ribosomal protein S13e